MRRIKIISIILAVIMFLCGWSLYYTHKKTTQIVRFVAQATDAVQAKDYVVANKIVQQVSTTWIDTGHVMVLFIKNETIEYVDMQFLALQVAIEQEEQSIALALLKQLQVDVAHLYHDELPYVQNIF